MVAHSRKINHGQLDKKSVLFILKVNSRRFANGMMHVKVHLLFSTNSPISTQITIFIILVTRARTVSTPCIFLTNTMLG